MIIQNNFNDKDANPLDNYEGIGKGSHSLDKTMENENKGLFEDNRVIQDIIDSDHEYNDENRYEDEWKLFR